MVSVTSTLNPICFSIQTPLLDILQQQDEAIKLGYPSGIALILNEAEQLIGTITDGDIRRASIKYRTYDLTAEDVMQSNPITFPEHLSFGQIIELLPKELRKRGRKSTKFLNKIILVDPENRPTRIIEYHQLWEQRVASHRHVVVVGLGYVGFTLALVLADRGFQTTGVEIDELRVEMLRKGESYVHERGIDELFERQLNKNFYPTTLFPEDGDVYIIAVGTPVVRPNRTATPAPNLDILQSAAKAVGKKLQPGNLVILRSTVPVGTTREVVLPILERASGLKGGVDFHLSFAPERTAEGKAVKELRELPQLIGGLNEESTEATAALFRDLTPTIVRLKSVEQAEIAKLLNNCFRDLIFSFSNQVAQIASHFNIDIVETIRAANQGYPRDPIPLPSPGVGGACLTKDPYIFSAVTQSLGIDDTLFEYGRSINESMHPFVVTRLQKEFEKLGKPLSTANILICGLAFKGEPETGDIRNSSSIEITNLLKPLVNKVYGHDPIAKIEDIIVEGITPVDIPDGFDHIDAVLFLNNHRYYEKIDISEMLARLNTPPIIFDGWKIFDPEYILRSGPCIYMGLSFTASSLK